MNPPNVCFNGELIAESKAQAEMCLLQVGSHIQGSCLGDEVQNWF